MGTLAAPKRGSPAPIWPHLGRTSCEARRASRPGPPSQPVTPKLRSRYMRRGNRACRCRGRRANRSGRLARKPQFLRFPVTRWRPGPTSPLALRTRRIDVLTMSHRVSFRRVAEAFQGGEARRFAGVPQTITVAWNSGSQATIIRPACRRAPRVGNRRPGGFVATFGECAGDRLGSS